jgi:hypothetical protein
MQTVKDAKMSINSKIKNIDEAEQLYEKYVKPLESTRRGEYVAVAPSGEMIFGPTVLDVLKEAGARFGPNNVVFKVGQRAVGKWR